MSDRQVDAFFYGLFMDEAILAENSIWGENPRQAYVDGYELSIGSRATLTASLGARSYGMIFTLTEGELKRLYGGVGLENYRPEIVCAKSLDGTTVSAYCYNLPGPEKSYQANSEYASRLRRTLAKLGFPAEYISGVS